MATGGSGGDKETRLAQALRANLRRRKAPAAQSETAALPAPAGSTVPVPPAGEGDR